MAIYGVKKQRGQVFEELKRTTPTSDLAKEVQGMAIKLDGKNEVQRKVEKAIEANDLCYNCETGFHYMKQ